MNIDTGEIKDFKDITDEERPKMVPLTKRQAERYSKLSPGERVGQYKADIQRKKAKEKKKRRLHNKLQTGRR